MGEIAAAVRAESEYLTQLDAAIGDGDHGINMNRGFDAVGKALAVQDGKLPPGQLHSHLPRGHHCPPGLAKQGRC